MCHLVWEETDEVVKKLEERYLKYNWDGPQNFVIFNTSNKW